MRIRIHSDVAKLVDGARKGKRSANAEVNMALSIYYNSKAHQEKLDGYSRKILKQISGPLPITASAFRIPKK